EYAAAVHNKKLSPKITLLRRVGDQEPFLDAQARVGYLTRPMGRPRRADSDDYETDYAYDYRNRLTSVTIKSKSDDTLSVTKVVYYTYDAFDQLVTEQIDADGDTAIDRAKVFMHDPVTGQIILIWGDDQDIPLSPLNPLKRNLWGPGVDQLLA